MSKPLLESEGWVVIGTLRCKCPRCGAELSSNAFARNTHKKKCEGWRGAERQPQAKEKTVTAPRYSADSQAERDEELGKFLSRDINPTPPPAPCLPWIEYRNGSWNEWDVTFAPPGSPRIYLRIREMSGCVGGNRYSSYAGKTYVGAYSTLEIAQGSAERAAGVK